MTASFSQISDNILETIQDRDFIS